jgi:hypothetical protein
MDDLELAALQRQLDDAFETTRPRRGYDDELWLKLQARRPFWTRLRDALAGLAGGIRELPAVPTATVAVVLIIAVGIGAIAIGSGLGQNRASQASLSTGQKTYAPNGPFPAGADTAFGRIPSPPFSPESNTAPQAAAGGPASPYGGQVTLTWTGQFDYSIQTAPVYRYSEPTRENANAFASSLGATPEGPSNGHIGSYSTADFQLQVDGTTPTPTDPRPPSAPTFFITTYVTTPPTVPAGTALADFASEYLAQHGLSPQWAYTVDVEGTSVFFLRQIPVPGYASSAHVIDSGGRYTGLEVDFSGDKLVRVAGPLPIGLASTPYRIIPADQAVKLALASSPPPPAGAPPRPTVQLNKAELVYALAPAGGYSYYEPALLLSGTFTFQGSTFVKLVLVPLVDPSLRSSSP